MKMRSIFALILALPLSFVSAHAALAQSSKLPRTESLFSTPFRHVNDAEGSYQRGANLLTLKHALQILESQNKIRRQSSLVGYWNFNELSGNVVFDGSAFGNDGTLTGATRSKGISLGGLSFDGTGGVLIPHSLSFG